MKGFAAILLVLVGFLGGILLLRSDVDASVLRLPGQLYELTDNQEIQNVYTFKLINKTTEAIEDVSFRLLSQEGSIQSVTHENVQIPAQGLAQGTLFIRIPQTEMTGEKVTLKIGVFGGNKMVDKIETNFMGPRSFR